MKGWNLFWWEQGHEDPPGYLRMGRSGPRNCGPSVMMWCGQETGRKTRAMMKSLNGPIGKGGSYSARPKKVDIAWAIPGKSPQTPLYQRGAGGILRRDISQ